MNPEWAAVGALAGLVAGAALRGLVFRLSVPAGAPDRTACPYCAAPVPRWPGARCSHCRGFLATPMALELVTAAVLALLAGRLGAQPDLLAFVFLGAIGVALAAIDLAVKRLPDRLTLPAMPVLAGLLAVAALATHDGAALERAVLGGAALAAAYLALAIVGRGQLGGGDVKLAGLAGMALGWIGWPTLVAGAALGFILAALCSLVLLAARRLTLRSAIAFGPYLLAGALVAILVGVPYPPG